MMPVLLSRVTVAVGQWGIKHQVTFDLHRIPTTFGTPKAFKRLHALFESVNSKKNQWSGNSSEWAQRDVGNQGQTICFSSLMCLDVLETSA